MKVYIRILSQEHLYGLFDAHREFFKYLPRAKGNEGLKPELRSNETTNRSGLNGRLTNPSFGNDC